MQTIIWAIGSMVVLTLIIIFLPLGYTLKGKFLLVITSFILSLGGIAAVSTFPIWQTSLMLIALIFFAAYFMNNRMGSLFLKENSVFEEVIDEELDIHEPVYAINSFKDDNLVKIDNELTLPDSSNINLEKDTMNVLSPSPIMSNFEEILANETETIDEDISFLQERNTEVDIYDQSEVVSPENSYLSDIESLLELESEQEDLLELSPIKVDVKKPAQLDEEEDEPLDDSLFDLLLAQKEVAAERDILEEIKPMNKVSLKK